MRKKINRCNKLEFNICKQVAILNKSASLVRKIELCVCMCVDAFAG